MKQKYLVYALLPVLGLGFVGVSIASAHGLFGFFGSNLTPEQMASNQQTMFQREADLLGISIEAAKDGWAQGKSLMQIAQDNGITQEQLQQKMKDARTQQLKTQLQVLVDNGIITQVQADQRFQFMETRMLNGKMGRCFRGGFGF